MSATSRILTKCEIYIVAEKETTGQSSTWEYIYRLMRCDIRLCPHKSDWCWENLKNKKYYKFRNPHLERLIDYIDKDSILDSYDNILGDICWNLVLESQAERKSKKLVRQHQNYYIIEPLSIFYQEKMAVLPR